MKDSYIAIDHGNTRLKATVFRGGEAHDSLTLEQMDHDAILEFADRHSAIRAIYASTAGVDVRLVESLEMMLPGGCLLLSSSTRVPINIDYTSPATLGADRIAAAVGAREICGPENLLIVDAGTCMTLDILEGDTFRGGNISPGLQLRFRSMHEYSGALPMLGYDDISATPGAFGHDTASAMSNGVILGITAEIAESFGLARKHYGVTRLLLTGGDAHLIAPWLKEKDIPLSLNESPVMTGLLKILQHNENL